MYAWGMHIGLMRLLLFPRNKTEQNVTLTSFLTCYLYFSVTLFLGKVVVVIAVVVVVDVVVVRLFRFLGKVRGRNSTRRQTLVASTT